MRYKLLALFLTSFYAFYVAISDATKNLPAAKQDRAVVIYCDPEYGSINSSVFYYNRTTKLLNLSFSVPEYLPDDTTLSFAGYRFSDGQYKATPVQITDKFSTLLDVSWLKLKKFLKLQFQPTLSWPIKPKVKYELTNFQIPNNVFPWAFPLGEWKCITKIYPDTTRDKRIFELHYYFTLKMIPEWDK